MNAASSNSDGRRLRRNRILYDIEALLDYLISILITDAFLATLLTRSGISDSATGIITQLASLGFMAQLVSVFMRRGKSIKIFVSGLCLACQMMFVSLYMIPMLHIESRAAVTALFAVMFLGGHIIQNVVTPYKLTWLMSFVPLKIRGSFSAMKEIISLSGGMLFTFGMGAMVDHFTDTGRDDIGFLLCGVTIFAVAVGHSVSLALIKESDTDGPSSYGGSSEGHGLIGTLRRTLLDKTVTRLFLIDVIWHFGTGLSLSFYGVYKINDLGFSLKYISLLSVMYAVSRILFSKFFGRYADRHSWAKMLIIAFTIAAAGFFINIFTVPSNGRYMFAIYYCIYAVSMGGINSGLMNITFDYAKPENYTSVLGIKSAFGGLSAFIASLIGGAVVSAVQKAGNRVFGIEIYAQQILTAVTFVTVVLLIIYMKKFIAPLPMANNEKKSEK